MVGDVARLAMDEIACNFLGVYAVLWNGTKGLDRRSIKVVENL